MNFEIPSTGKTIDLSLTWDTQQDLDLYLYNAAGKVVASGLTTKKPETLKYDTKGAAGTYFVRVYNYTAGNAVAKFKLDITAP